MLEEEELWVVWYHKKDGKGTPQLLRGRFLACGRLNDFPATLEEALAGNAIVIDPRTGERLLQEGIDILNAGDRRNGKGGEG